MNLRPLQVITMFGVLTSSTIIYAEQRICPSTIENSYKCAKYAEKALSKQYPTLFKRINDKLIISLSNGNKKVYINTNQEEGSGAGYSFVQYYPDIGYGLVDRQEWEGGWQLLVNLKNGKELSLTNRPTLSPDKKRLAVTNVDLESHYTKNKLAVYRLEPSGVVTEYVQTPTDWGADSERWISNTEISFVKYTGSSMDNGLEKKMKLKYYNNPNTGKGTWRIE